MWRSWPRTGLVRPGGGHRGHRAGIISWGMSLEEAAAGLCLSGRPAGAEDPHEGQPRLLVEHRRQDEPLFRRRMGFATLEILHNNCHFYGEHTPCAAPGDGSMRRSRRARARRSFNRELHAPGGVAEGGGGAGEALLSPLPAPTITGYRCQEILDLLEQYQRDGAATTAISTAAATAWPLEGRARTAWQYHLVSADYLGFRPQKICGMIEKKSGNSSQAYLIE